MFTARPASRSRVDLLRWPVLGRFLRWRHARTALQVPLLVLAGLAVFDGLFGPQLAPKNLATVGIWLLFRGLVVLGLLAAGNLFCLACPFMLPRQGARRLRERWLGGGRVAPAWMRGKWMALALLVVFFYCYELFDLWASPRLTAWVIVAYFVAAFLVDLGFRGAAFCKHACPLGQFNFVGSLISPLEIRAREAAACASCPGKDCITASARAGEAHGGARGCELWLYQPRKIGNMDCTFCLDCIHACPYENVGICGRVPSSELWSDPYRSGIGRFSRRADLAALVVLFVFGAYINAFAMIRPVYGLQEGVGRLLGSPSPALGLAVIFLCGLGLLPVAGLGAAGVASRRLSGDSERSLGEAVAPYAFALVPLGFAMWLAHYTFHFLSGGLTIVPVVQSFLVDVGLSAAAPQWGLGPIVPLAWLYPIEAAMLYAGGLGSMIAAFRIAQARAAGAGRGISRSKVLGAALPWVALVGLLLAWGLWILVQPMEMRGTWMMAAPGR